MKIIIGSLLWIGGFSSLVVFKTSLGLDSTEFIASVIFILFVGMLVAFSDRLKSLKALGGGVEFAERRISKFTDDAIARIKETVDTHSAKFSELTLDADNKAIELRNLESTLQATEKRLRLLASGEPQIMPIGGVMQAVMIYEDENGRLFGDYTDYDGTRKRGYFKRRNRKTERNGEIQDANSP